MHQLWVLHTEDSVIGLLTWLSRAFWDRVAHTNSKMHSQGCAPQNGAQRDRPSTCRGRSQGCAPQNRAHRDRPSTCRGRSFPRPWPQGLLGDRL